MSYAWALEQYSDNWSAEFDTVGQCVEEAKYMGYEAGTIIYVDERKEPEIRGIELSDILEKVHDNMYIDYGEYAEDWNVEDTRNVDPKVYEKYEEAVNDIIVKYIKEIGMEPNFKEVVRTKQVVIQ
ncbi:hypothetical protein [Anaerostipes sp.]|jgi:hypothetical protein|uniref:Uncharacterized protein n=1 Tax=Myoviridae sp. ctzwE5 TaxID=2825214 RepID=A0A8S5PWX7_9CAUD|nr:hypothetical protein [Anaerostipes sp.]MED9814709.1 hypothetical protein [Anaerostipes sp.]DAE11097.1 MAG TPA: hypothetical protein [Myoviridae sp. ctzwE5]